MSVPMRVSDRLYEEAKQISQAECRTPPAQIEFWARIGKCALENPDLPIDYIRELLVAKYADRSLAKPFKFEDDE